MRRLVLIFALLAMVLPATTVAAPPPPGKAFDGLPDGSLTQALLKSSVVTLSFAKCKTRTARCLSKMHLFIHADRAFLARAGHIAGGKQTDKCKLKILRLRKPALRANRAANNWAAGHGSVARLYFTQRTFLYKALSVHTACK